MLAPFEGFGIVGRSKNKQYGRLLGQRKSCAQRRRHPSPIAIIFKSSAYDMKIPYQNKLPNTVKLTVLFMQQEMWFYTLFLIY